MFKGYRVWEMPPNNQGIAALEMLRILESYDLKAMGHNSATYLHHLIEAKKLAYADLARCVCDPLFHDVEVDALLSKDFAAARARQIDPGRANPEVHPGRLGNSIAGDFYFAFRHLQVLSNELGEPKLLICAVDTRTPASSFATLRNENVSYFIGKDADETKPQTILAGDRNITSSTGNGSTDYAFGTYLGTSIDAAWMNTMHVNAGNLLLSDGSVQQTTTQQLRDQISEALSGGSTNVMFSLPQGVQ